MVHRTTGEIEYRLLIHPGSHGQPWHATLEHPNPGNSQEAARLEFESPLELVAHLEHLSDGPTEYGLR
jgi:hypothetical protein